MMRKMKKQKTIFQILQAIDWPQQVCVIDYETYTESLYHLNTKRKGGMSIAEYLNDPRFNIIGTAYAITNNASISYHFSPQHGVDAILNFLQPDQTVFVGHNLIFDGSILVDKFGYVPQYCIDTISLSRYFEARGKHNLDECCERWLDNYNPKKYILKRIQGRTWKQLRPELKRDVTEYSKHDIQKTWMLLNFLLPRLPRPDLELEFTMNTLKRYWLPKLEYDFEKSTQLKQDMRNEMEAVIESVVW